MTVASYFSSDYDEARGKFLGAAASAGAEIAHIRNPARGPGGGELFTDTAWVGPKDAARVLVTMSATHGVEGFCGSGVQVGWFDKNLHMEMEDGFALLAIHAINPHGFAWLRRVTEDNVDLNRNFIDHNAPYPTNEGYDELHEAICPREWNDAAIAETGKVIEAYLAKHGARSLQSAISGGQYSHADGLFFGGHAHTWSHDTLLKIFADHLAKARHVAVIDYHTGLGRKSVV